MCSKFPAQEAAERMRADVSAHPAYARRILECLDLGIDPAANDAQMESARQLRTRRELGLPEDASTEQVVERRRQLAEEEYRWLRNRDMG